MTLWKYCALLATSAVLCSLPATVQAADAKQDLGANAAMKYWQAFAHLSRLDKEQEKLLENWNSVPLDEATQKVLDAGTLSLLYLHRGAKLPRCDWSLDLEDGPTLWMPHLEKARTLSRLACLRARYEFGRGNTEAALDDVAATLMLARHGRSDAILICMLVQFHIELNALDLVAQQLPQLSAAPLKALAARLETLPPGSSIKEALLIERDHFSEWFIRKLKAVGDDPKGVLHVVTQMMGSEQEAQTFLKSAGSPTPRKLMQLLEELAPYYDEMAKVLALPHDQFQPQFTALMQKAKAANPLAGLLLPALDKVIAAEHRTRARMALFKAALAVAQKGPDALQTIVDPFGQGPFEYRARPQGFELKSKLLYQGQPVTLTVGPPDKK